MPAKPPPHSLFFEPPEIGSNTCVVSFAPEDRDMMWQITSTLKDQGIRTFNIEQLKPHESHAKVYAKQYLPAAKVGIVLVSDDFFTNIQCNTELTEMAAAGLTIVSLKVAKHFRPPSKFAKFLTRPSIPSNAFSIFENDFDNNIRGTRSELLSCGVKPASSVRAKRISPTKPGGNRIDAGKDVFEPMMDPQKTQSAPVNIVQSIPVDDESSDEEDNFVRLPRMSVQITGGKVVVGNEDLRQHGSGAASNTTQALVRTHKGNKSQKWTANYRIVKPLGQGAFGMVSKVKHKLTKEEYAMKAIDLSKLGGERLLNLYLSLREIELMKKLDHPNIIKVYEIYRAPDTINIVMELCTGGELGDKLESMPPLKCPAPFPEYLSRFTSEDARSIAIDMINSVNYIHLNGIVHRDIKVENFIYAGPGKGEGTLKMIDFGLSRPINATETMTANVGSMIYKAPEVGTTTPYTENSDLWSIGIVMQMLVTGLVPWEGSSAAEIHSSVMKETKDPEGFKDLLCWFHNAMNVSPECSDFIVKLLTPDHTKRPSASQMRTHVYLKGERANKSVTGEYVERAKRGSNFAVSRNISDGNKKTIVQKLKEFKDKGALKRTAMLALSFGMDGKKLSEIGKKFSEADTNGDGLISHTEFAAMMKKDGHHTSTEIDQYFKAINQDGTGKIKYSEFVAALVEEAQMNSHDQLEAAFKRLDVDNSGALDERDFAVLLSKTYGDAAVKRVMAQADSNSDGKIDLAEFKAAVIGIEHSLDTIQE